MTLLVFATVLEARSFIECYRLKKRAMKRAYELYEGEALSLIITGMGVLNGAVNLADLVLMQKKEGAEIRNIINYGVCGCLDGRWEIGEVVEIDRVIKYDAEEFSRTNRGKYFSSSFPDIILREKGKVERILATSDHPVFTRDDARRISRYAHLVDMEGYGYAFVARNYYLPIRLVKAVSDYMSKQSEVTFKRQVNLCLERLLSFHITEMKGEK